MSLDAHDEQLARILRDAADLAPDPPGALLADGAERRWRRARRRKAALAGSAGVVALAAVAAVALRPWAAPTDIAPAAPAGGWPERITAAFMADTLTAVLPPGQVTAAGGSGSNDGPVPGLAPTAHLIYDDGHGAGMVTLSVNRATLPIRASTWGTECPDPVEAPTEACERTVRPDGSIVVVAKLKPVEPMKVRKWQATYTGADGRQVQIWEVNSTSFGPPLSREEPPLSADQLVAAATSSAWDPLFAQPGSPGTSPAGAAQGRTPEPQGPEPERILATVAGALPAGTRTDSGAAQHVPGRAHVSVTLEGRTSMLSVSVTPGPDTDGGGRAGFEADAEPGALSHTADGSSVLVRESGATKSGGGPTVLWSVEVRQADGTRVRVSQWNGADETQMTPGKPALTTDQLKAVATAPGWRH
ncbi:hypothetical protein [Kitasatospora sp. NPDC048538]|uniref:hypothetical protein n=1 Tax=unclassified Kitasatospora TaxID=2633591 RepID=UPI0033F821D9